MSEVKIKIKIADRQYSLRTQATEEETIKKAEHIVNEKINKKKHQLNIYETQSLLAMVAFDSVMENIKSSESESSIKGRVYKLRKSIESVLEDKS